MERAGPVVVEGVPGAAEQVAQPDRHQREHQAHQHQVRRGVVRQHDAGAQHHGGTAGPPRRGARLGRREQQQRQEEERDLLPDQVGHVGEERREGHRQGGRDQGEHARQEPRGEQEGHHGNEREDQLQHDLEDELPERPVDWDDHRRQEVDAQAGVVGVLQRAHLPVLGAVGEPEGQVLRLDVVTGDHPPRSEVASRRLAATSATTRASRPGPRSRPTISASRAAAASSWPTSATPPPWPLLSRTAPTTAASSGQDGEGLGGLEARAPGRGAESGPRPRPAHQRDLRAPEQEAGVDDEPGDREDGGLERPADAEERQHGVQRRGRAAITASRLSPNA